MLRKPDSIAAKDTIVEDPILDPYFITKSTVGGYTVYQRVEKGTANTKYIKTINYPASFNSALKTIATQKLNHHDKLHYTSLKEYIATWREIEQGISNLTTI